MKRLKKRLLSLMMMAAVLAIAVGCARDENDRSNGQSGITTTTESDRQGEDLGDDMDHAADDADNLVDDAADGAGDIIDDAGDAIDNAADEMDNTSND